MKPGDWFLFDNAKLQAQCAYRVLAVDHQGSLLCWCADAKLDTEIGWTPTGTRQQWQEHISAYRPSAQQERQYTEWMLKAGSALVTQQLHTRGVGNRNRT